MRIRDHHIVFGLICAGFIILCGYFKYQMDKLVFIHYQNVTATKGVK